MKTKYLAGYTALTFALTWAVWFWVAANPANFWVASFGSQIVALSMWVPGLCALLVWWLARKKAPFQIKLRLRLRGRGKAYIGAYYEPLLRMLAGAALFFLAFPGWFGADGLARAALQYGQTLGSGVSETARSVAGWGILAVNLLLAPFFNLFFALGEEIGWRGLMMPALLERMTEKRAVLLGGLIWGLWHAPVIVLLGHNYGFSYWGYPVTGIALMCLVSVAENALLTHTAHHADSVWAAALEHGAVNAFATLPLVFLSSSAPAGCLLLGPAPCGLIAGIPTLLWGAWALFRKTGGGHERGRAAREKGKAAFCAK